MLKNKFVVLGVTGSIAAYKSADLVRLLKKRGARVQVIMTKSACKFVKPLTFQVLSQNPVITDMFREPYRWEVEHVALADSADIILVAPATANIIAKIAAGIADDILTATILATRAKVVIAPAMNVHMYENPITQKNIEYLKGLGIKVLEPEEGPLACGYTGRGRFPAAEDIINILEELVGKAQDLKGRTFLITAGPTREPIDPIRYISNHSSGKMGYSLAHKAIIRGARVILVSGPTNITPPAGLYKFVPVETAIQMEKAVLENFNQADVVIKAAAVADYRPKKFNPEKIKKKDDEMIVELVKNPDILQELGKKKQNQVLVGFAAETDKPEKNALEKLKRKNLDFIVLNDVTQEGAGFGSDTNIVKIIYKDGRSEALPRMLKEDVADDILDRVLPFLTENG
ncbi:MAG: bifunctional phosphopantothenoylcysteine decarboxylase/phosphopantothenate--cysteine ligase CoaBC [Tepidanaerobacteraceae bacterium]|jgi:phosphopantothenoylcysteine decarboxylase/phosphopantothenate--cysteine ligase|nr:bifunctional phosphopantothenoylcysteine decarboxylase/phosphopantothenate--cysteine ligase CoaBC [Tepidanaerobacteraceae bacterium]